MYNLPEDILKFVKNIYGENHLNFVFDGNINTFILALKPIESMSKEDSIEFHEVFKSSPVINKETAKFLIQKGYDCFGFVKKGWVCNYTIYKEKGYNEAIRLKDKFFLKYERELRGEEEKIGLKEDSQTSLVERKSWMQFATENENESISSIEFIQNEFTICYFINDYGKFSGVLCVDTNGELIYESKFHYRFFKNNIYLYKYENTEGKEWNYDTKYSKR